jgi:hypothetical protein
VGFDYGELSCSTNCTFDTSDCVKGYEPPEFNPLWLVAIVFIIIVAFAAFKYGGNR